MNEWLKKVTAKAKEMWSKWKPIQKVILFGIIIVVIVVIVATAKVSSKPSMVRLFPSPVTNETNLAKILDRINQENVDVEESEGYIYVADKRTKTRLTAILNDEGLIPSNVDIWADYFDRSWSTTDADQNVKLQVKKQEELRKFIESYSDVQFANVSIELPPDKLFQEDQTPVKCSVIIGVKGNSDLLSNTKRIRGIHNAIIACVDGLKDENLIITDTDGIQKNDFAGMEASEAVDIVAKQQKLIVKRENEIRAKVLQGLTRTYGSDRCRDIFVSVDMDMSNKKIDSTEYSPIIITPDNKDTPYDDSEKRDYLPYSQQTVTNEYTAQGWSPQGPPGTAGQNTPQYSDLSNVVGHSVQTGVTQNNVINTTQTSQIASPKIDRVTVSVNIDGTWKLKVDPEKKTYMLDDEGFRIREYTPLTPAQIKNAEDQIKGAIGYSEDRGDRVWVTNEAFDRAQQFRDEDLEYFAKQNRTKTIVLILIAVVVVLVGFILFRIISKEIERRRREREARLLAEQQAARERALWDAKEDGMEVTMSVEETRRMELQENAITMAKEHPEDVAMLIRTWLMEE